MSKRLNEERQKRLEPKRMRTVLKTLSEMGFNIHQTKCGKGLDCTRLKSNGDYQKFIIYPFSGWWSGKGIGSGRGFINLIEKL